MSRSNPKLNGSRHGVVVTRVSVTRTGKFRLKLNGYRSEGRGLEIHSGGSSGVRLRPMVQGRLLVAYSEIGGAASAMGKAMLKLKAPPDLEDTGGAAACTVRISMFIPKLNFGGMGGILISIPKLKEASSVSVCAVRISRSIPKLNFEAMKGMLKSIPKLKGCTSLGGGPILRKITKIMLE